MELHEYRKDFIETVKSLAAAEGDFEETAFVRLSAGRLMDAEELDNFEDCYYEGAGKKNKKLMIHGYSFDDVDGSVKLVISSYHGREEPETLIQTELAKVFDRLKSFTEEALTGGLHLKIDESSPTYGLAYELFKQKDDIRRFKLYLVTDSILSSRVKDLVEDRIFGIPVEYNVWDISRFYRVFESYTGKDPLFVDFSQYKDNDVLCLEAGQKQGEYQAYLCIIPGEVVAQVYDRFGSRLLEGNVRSFLSTKGKVNKGIRNTIINEPEMFFAYNNGISATATEAEFSKSERGLHLISATNLQIVNGGQTTASLLMTKLNDRQDLSKVYVQMKLSVITPETADNVVPLIARYANSQNQISEADFFSNHPYHIRMEGFSRRIWAPAESGAQYETHWFYERAKGQYLNEQSKMTPSEQRKFLLQNPRHKVITKTDLGKYHFSFKGHPHLVSLGPQKNFKHFAQWLSKQWEESDLEFNEEYFRNSVAYAILFKKTEILISDQPWYQGSYRQNFVTYTIALLAYVIEKKFKDMVLDLRAIWNNQSLSEVLYRQLVVLAKAAHDVIVNPELGIQIIQEWCKKELCWDRVKQSEVIIVEGFENALVNVSEMKKTAMMSKAQQRVDNGIDAQVKIFELGVDYWTRLRGFGLEKKLISFEEDKLLNVAIKMTSGLMPTDKQSLRLLGLNERLISEGFAG